MKRPKLKIINSEKEHKRALATIEQLWESKPGTEEHDALEVLALLVEDYEKRTFPMEEPDPVAAYQRSGYAEKIVAERTGGAPAGWGA